MRGRLAQNVTRYLNADIADLAWRSRDNFQYWVGLASGLTLLLLLTVFPVTLARNYQANHSSSGSLTLGHLQTACPLMAEAGAA